LISENVKCILVASIHTDQRKTNAGYFVHFYNFQLDCAVYLLHAAKAMVNDVPRNMNMVVNGHRVMVWHYSF